MYDLSYVYQATNLEDALHHLKMDKEARLIAGGTDMLIKLRNREVKNVGLISIHDLEGLRGIRMSENQTLVIGPLTTFADLANSQLIKKHIPILAQAAREVGGPQIRNMGTLGGNICNGVTSADSAPPLFVLNAFLEITGLEENGEIKRRSVAIRDFYEGPGKVRLDHEEILTSIHITRENYESYFGFYIKYAMRKAMDIATLSCAVLCRLDDTKEHLEDLRLSFGVAGPVPMRCYEVEAYFRHARISDALFEALGQRVKLEVHPRDSWRASKILRLKLVENLSQRALKESIKMAREGEDVHV